MGFYRRLSITRTVEWQPLAAGFRVQIAFLYYCGKASLLRDPQMQ